MGRGEYVSAYFCTVSEHLERLDGLTEDVVNRRNDRPEVQKGMEDGEG